MITVFGIKQCSTMKKTFDWLESRNVPYAFHDYKKAGIERPVLHKWITELGWERLVNTRGTTWRNLPPDAKTDLDAEKALALMLANPSLIKRPVLDNGCSLCVGFDEHELTNFTGSRA